MALLSAGVIDILLILILNYRNRLFSNGLMKLMMGRVEGGLQYARVVGMGGKIGYVKRGVILILHQVQNVITP